MGEKFRQRPLLEGPTEGALTDTLIRTKKPRLYKVVLHNDDFTPMDFVVTVLERFFNKDHSQATEIMLRVHNHGHAVCGVYTCEIAEMKVLLVSEFSRENEYPLKCSMEPE